jgi:ribosomal protein S18 acetylase RimI-like enzyme
MDTDEGADHSAQTTPVGLQIRLVRTAQEFEAVRAVRRVVFHEEQGLVGSEVTDSDDARSIHALALLPIPETLTPEQRAGAARAFIVDDMMAVAVGRLTGPLLPTHDWHISWVATLPEFRGQGIGSRLMRVLINEAERRGAARISLSAQGHAIRFYERLGFRAVGHQWEVQGVPHQRMERITCRA